MSRSYKKNPIYTDRPHGAKYWKRVGNKKVRKNNNTFPKGKKYKRMYNSWEIHDYISRYSKCEAIKDYYYSGIFINGKWFKTFNEYKNEQEFLNKYWKKNYLRK